MNLSKNEKNLATDYKGYTFESKFMPGMDTSRVSVMIKSDITYERLSHLEDDYANTIWIRVKTSKNKYIYIQCTYRQWALPGELNLQNTDTLPSQLSRLQNIMSPIEQLSNDGKTIITIGDYNIDLWPPNDPYGKFKNGKLLSIYKEVLDLFS